VILQKKIPVLRTRTPVYHLREEEGGNVKAEAVMGFSERLYATKLTSALGDKKEKESAFTIVSWIKTKKPKLPIRVKKHNMGTRKAKWCFPPT